MGQIIANTIKQSIIELIGHTPLLALNQYTKELQLEAEIIAKLEYFNPANSVKDRIAKAMIEDAEARGVLTKDKTIIETTSGNTGIGLAAIAAAKGYKLRIYMQDGVSEERTKVVKAYGTEVVPFSDVPEMVAAFEETDGDFVETIKVFRETVVDKDENVVFLNQLDNEANPNIHERTTGPEIWEDTAGQIDIFVAAIGTGGTISGVGAYLKSKNPAIQIIGVEPAINSIATVEQPDIIEITGVHRFSDAQEARVPSNVHLDRIDEVLEVETDEAYKAARTVAQTDGVLVGTSSGAALFVATTLAKRPENKGKRIVVLFPDTGLRYLSTDLF
ncbi:cysteine synthase family protein [Lysinibacillus sphaericus]|uniref:cysteine synthase n=1 Tax=Lysinibacillus sphaericus TaxID=1421 RepID=A0A2S0JYN6_LYSSH|nr:cysteine synthase family protein [Lysinibacillus sphaericus]AVK96179.1 cysteine synthase [Lysinibacillus sphaericus]MED4544539.1 cysteine synthase family protein [Lysinibacillus sphaericus]TKI20666.1 cysteine synthase family protein [Lysinibacillus sphaericus]SUV18057.1 cysteine synthase A [Lysinibacillus sphaericus]GEC80695.1 cysteine synthase A [Lysinibacillus sphaericus]